jgi:hypothetical protein
MKPPPRLLDPASDSPPELRALLGAIRVPPAGAAARKRVARRLAATLAAPSESNASAPVAPVAPVAPAARKSR